LLAYIKRTQEEYKSSTSTGGFGVTIWENALRVK